MRDREGLFNEYILEVRRREKDEKVQKKETVSKHRDEILLPFHIFFDYFCRFECVRRIPQYEHIVFLGCDI